MASPVCYIVNKNIDGKIAERLGMKPEMVASLRGLYDTKAREEGTEELLPEDVITPTDEQIAEAADKIMKFRADAAKRNKERIATTIKHVDRAWDILRHVYSLEQRSDRVKFLSTMFSQVVDKEVQKHNVDRQAYISGFPDSRGIWRGGEFAILEKTYDKILELMNLNYEYSKNSDYYFEKAKHFPVTTTENGQEITRYVDKLDYVGAPKTASEYKEVTAQRAEEYQKILENWEALVPFVLKDLMKKEGVKLGIKKEYRADAHANDFGDNNLADTWDVSESVRDGWQRNNDLESAFGSVGQQVRRILGTIPMMEEVVVPVKAKRLDGSEYTTMDVRFVPVLDDLGNPKYIDPIKAHQELQEFLKGCTSSEDLLKRMCKDNSTTEAKIAWMQPIVDVLNSQPMTRTQFFVDFKRNFQPYSIMFEDKKKSNFFNKIYGTKLLNRAKNYLLAKHLRTISPKGKLPSNVEKWGVEPVFNPKTKEVNWKRLKELRELVLLWTKEEIGEVENVQVGDIRTQTRYNVQEAKDIKPAPLVQRGQNAYIKLNGKDVRITDELKRNFLMEVFSSLGYDVTVDAVDSIIHSGDIYTIRDELEQLFDPDENNAKSGFIYVAKQEWKEERPMSYYSLFNKGVNTKSREVNHAVKDHSARILELLSDHQVGKRVESRVRYQGNTMYSFVNPSYLGDRLELIQSFVDNDNKEGLLQFLKDEYLCSPFFVDKEYLETDGMGGHILNMWLADMVEACNNKRVPLKNSVAAIFNYERDLGKDDKKFEDFTAKEHCLDMFIHFFADQQQNKGYGGKGKNNLRKKLSAMYPVFILGDAGVSKYIRAPRISSAVLVDKEGKQIDAEKANSSTKVAYRFDRAAQDRILDEFFNIYLQEQRRMSLDEAMAYKMYANGKEVKHPKGEFSILTFLNDSKYAIPEGKEGDEITIKETIRRYLNDAAIGNDNLKKEGRKSFKQRMEDLGILAVDSKGGSFKYLKEIASTDPSAPNNIDAVISEFYWNTKLATALQLQLMTIDPSFYHGTKDLQKRYKEIHAPGTVLDVTARNPFSAAQELYSEDGIERVVYFDDINVNAEESDPAFMEMILRTFSKPETDVNALIANGILTPSSDQNVERERQGALKEALGKNYDIYSSYCKNTLTDGQGYRTLSSYRKVMGMAGKWTKTQEDAYQTIMAIRAKHRADDSDTTPDELKQIASLAVTLQPIKPYMFTHEKVKVTVDGVNCYHLIPVQHKYAEALIIPELMPKGSKLRDLANWMEDHNVDMVGSTKIGKVGVFGQAKIGAVTDKNSLETAMSQAYIHELPYRDYRIQTNVPEHISGAQLFGTQVRKLIMSGLNMKDAAAYYQKYLDGVGNFAGTVNLSTDGGETNSKNVLNGRNLLALYNSLICANILDSYDTFAQRAANIEQLAELLQQSTVGSMRESMDNLFSYVVTGNEEGFKQFLIPLFEGGLEHDTATLILSTFKKIVNKQQISGGSAVQVSAFGIDGYEIDGGLRAVADPENAANILYAEIEMPFDKSFMVEVKGPDGHVTKKPVQLSYEQYCYPNGYLVPSGEAIEKTLDNGKINPLWRKYQSYTYKEVDGKLVPCKYNDPEAKVYKPLIEEEYPDILSILAYRIPTERDYSMINCQIKRFTPKTAGGTLKVPPQWTTIAGFDFDIDKLYFMQREYYKHYNDSSYVESKFSKEDKKYIWDTFYQNNPKIYNALIAAREQWERENPDKIKWIPVIRNGVHVKDRIDPESRRTLNSFWEEAEIEKLYGKSKRSAFAETAIAEGKKPSENVVKGEVTEWMDEYDFNLPPEKNSRHARNNLLITLMQARLMDPETVKQRYTPGGFANASDAALRMRVLQFADVESITTNGVVDNSKVDAVIAKIKDKEDPLQDPEPNYDPTDPYTMLIYNQQNQIAAKLIGIFANQNTNHAFASAMDVFELNEPIEFCGHKFKDFLHKNDLAEAAEIDLNMAEFLAASVDAVKDPVLNFLNLNIHTADAGAVLARLGYNTREIGLLFTQPVIKTICEAASNKGSNIRTEITNARNKLTDKVKSFDANKQVPLTEQDLTSAIVKERVMLEQGRSTDDFLDEEAAMQLQVVQLFEHIIEVANDISNFVTNTKFTASNAVSSTFGGLYAQQLRVQEYVDKFPKDSKDKGKLSYTVTVAKNIEGSGLFDKPIENDERYLTMSKEEYLHMVRFNPFAFEQTMYDANRKAIKLLGKYYPYETDLYKGIRGKMNELARYGTLSEDDVNEIHSNIPVALLAKQNVSLFNGEKLHENTGMTNREYYRKHFASVVADMLNEHPELEELAIFKYMFPEEVLVTVYNPETGFPKKDDYGYEITESVWKMTLQDVGGMDADVKEEIRESWAYLMEVKDDGTFDSQDYAELGRDLFMYCFYQLGFDYSPISFMHLAPTAVKDFIPVPRSNSLSIGQSGTYKGNIRENTNDVFVWFPSEVGSKERAKQEFGANLGYVGELSGNSFQLPEKLSKGKDDNGYTAVRALYEEAISHPELRFKIAKDLTADDWDFFVNASDDIPSNILFSEASITTIPEELRDKISYGRKRSYRQFLYEILEGKEQELNEDEFAQMWILNHLDNPRFVMDTNRCNETLRKIIKEITREDGPNSQRLTDVREGGKFRNILTFDVSKYNSDTYEDALKDLVSIKRSPYGEIIECKWCPCLLINGSFYLAESGTTQGFNVNKSLVMNYRKVEPWGSSNQLEFDGNRRLTPQMRYQTSLNAVVETREEERGEVDNNDNNPPVNPTPTPTPSPGPTTPVTPTTSTESPVRPETDEDPNTEGATISMTRWAMENYIFKAFIEENTDMQPEDKKSLRLRLRSESDTNILDTVKGIMEEHKDGRNVVMLGADGKKTIGC